MTDWFVVVLTVALMLFILVAGYHAYALSVKPYVKVVQSVKINDGQVVDIGCYSIHLETEEVRGC